MTKEEEVLFRKYYLEAETRAAAISMLILMAPLLAFIYNDFQFLGPGTMFNCVAGARVLLFLATLGVVLFLIRNKNYRVHDWVITVWSVIGLTILVLISFSRPGYYIGHAVMDVVIIMIVYLALPNRLVSKTLLCLVFSIAEVVILIVFRSQYDTPVLFTIILSLLIANAAGFISTWQIGAMRRTEFRSRTEVGKVSDELKRLSETDDLTGIYNNRAFRRIGTDELARFRRYGRPLSFIMLDLDHFKLVNDNYGHMVGDAVLRQVATAMLAELREVDIMGRLGGEEFGILLPETLVDDARIVAGRLNDAMHRLIITADGGQRIDITISLGVAEAESGDTGLDSLMARADKALYKAKEKGRDRFEVI